MARRLRRDKEATPRALRRSDADPDRRQAAVGTDRRGPPVTVTDAKNAADEAAHSKDGKAEILKRAELKFMNAHTSLLKAQTEYDEASRDSDSAMRQLIALAVRKRR